MEQKSSVLIVTDSMKSDWLEHVLAKHDLKEKIDLIGLGYSAEAILKAHKKKTSGLRVSSLDSRQDYQNLCEEIRNDFPMFNFTLSKTVEKNLRVTLGKNKINLWHFLPLIEKNLWLGEKTLVHRLFYLRMVQEKIRDKNYKKVILSIEDDVLKRSLLENFSFENVTCLVKRSFKSVLKKNWLAYLCKYFFFILKVTALLWQKKGFLKTIHSKSLDHETADFTFFSYFPYFWEDLANPESKERFFQFLTDKIRQSKNIQWLCSLSNDAFKKNKDLIQAVVQNRNIKFLEKNFSFRDMAVFFHGDFIRAALKVIFFEETVKYVSKKNAQSLDVSSLVHDELRNSLISYAFVSNMYMYLNALRTVGKMNVSKFIYRLEFQPYENALIAALPRSAVKIGFQHSAVGRNFLSYVFTEGELQTSTGSKTPDYILTTGHSSQRFLSKGGFPTEKIKVVGPVRYAKILEERLKKTDPASLRRELSLPQDKFIIYVASAPILGETISLLQTLMGALENRKDDFMVILKTHPSEEFGERYKDILKENLQSHQFIFLEGVIPFYKYLQSADCIIITGTTVGIEAMLLGQCPIVFEALSQFGNDSLVDHAEASFRAWDTHSLKKAMADIENDDLISEEKKKHWGALFKDVFADIDSEPNEKFVDALRSFKIL